jgi:hypothetical protein
MWLSAVELGNALPIDATGTVDSCRPPDKKQPKCGRFPRLLFPLRAPT